jgi:hypothetical protein
MKKIIHGKYLFSLLAFFQLFSFKIFADLYVSLDTGYRCDRINEAIQYVDDAFALFASDENAFQNLQGYTVGAKWLWCIPCFPLLVKGQSHYTWFFDGGGYNEQYLVKGDCDGHAIDVSSGIGYIFSFCNCVDIVPLIGGSFDKQRMFVLNSRPFDTAGAGPTAQDFKFTAEWYGPWIGLDFCFCNCFGFPLSFNAGYEFHYGWTHVMTKPQNQPVNLVFGYTVDGNNMTGHVFHIDGIRCFWKRWFVGLGVQYTCWTNHHKTRVKPTTTQTGLSPTQFVRETFISWRSIKATLDLGYRF